MGLSFEFSNILGAVYHRGTIKYGPDGSSIFSPVGNKIIMYDLKSNRYDSLPVQVNYNINQISIHPNGSIMLASSEKSHLYIISLAAGKLLHFKEYKTFPIISHVSFSPDGRYYCISGDNMVLIYITPGSHVAGRGREIMPFRVYRKFRVNHDQIQDITWSGDSRLLCVASRDTSLNIFTISEQQMDVIHLRGHTDAIVRCFFANTSPHDKQLYSLTKNCHLSIWDELSDNDDDNENQDDEDQPQEDDQPNRKRMKKKMRYQRSSKHYLRLTTDPEDLKEVRHKITTAYITSADFNQNAKILAVGYNTGHYALYEMPTATLIYELDSKFGMINSVAINPTGDWIAFGSSIDPETDKLNANNRTQSRLFVFEWQSKSNILDQVGSGATMTNMHECASYSLDGTYIVSGNLAGRIKVWSAINGETIATFGEEHNGPIKSLKFAPNKSGKVIVSASLDGTIRAYDLNKYKNFRTFQSPVVERRPEFISLDIDSSGEFIAAGTYNYFEIYLFSLQTGKFLEYLTGHEGPVSGVAFSPNTNILVSSSWDTTARIWNLFEGSNGQRDVIEFADEVITVAFRPDGNQFAVSTRNGLIALFNPHTVEQMGTSIEGSSDLGSTQLITEVSRDNRKYFLTLNYSADGTYIIAGGNSNHICIYHANQKVLVKKIALTFNMSMDGVFDYVSNRRKNEFGFSLEALNSRTDERGDKPIKLPGVRSGDLGERQAMPIIAAYQVVFSPAMRSFAAATTEGVLLYSLDATRNFNPYKLVVGVDPTSIKRALKTRCYGQAFVEALQLNDKLILQEVIETIPTSEMDAIVASLEIDYVKRTLDFISQVIPKTKHIEYYLSMTKGILYRHGVTMKQLPSRETGSIVRNLHQNFHRQLMDMKKNCDHSKYSLKYLTRNLDKVSVCEDDADVEDSDEEMNGQIDEEMDEDQPQCEGGSD